MARHKSKDMETILAVYSTKDAESASLALLKADVECVRRKIGAGKYGNFLLSLNNYGEEICVDPRDKEKPARSLKNGENRKHSVRIRRRHRRLQKLPQVKTPGKTTSCGRGSWQVWLWL